MYSYRFCYNLTFFSIFLLFIYCFEINAQSKGKICGVNIVSPKNNQLTSFQSLNVIQPNWIALNPVVLLKEGSYEIEYPSNENFIGDYPKNVDDLIIQAKRKGYKILLKPMFRCGTNDWAGDFLLQGNQQIIFEQNFTKLMLSFAKQAEQGHVELFCIGTELKTFVLKRPSYWKSLIKKIREIYKGQITYAANWDSFDKIEFWDKLDIIGVDAYFPLSNAPNLDTLKQAWQKPMIQLEKLSKQFNRPIVFTEFGYRSIHKATWKQWEIENMNEKSSVNLNAQTIGYQAIFESVWKQNWFIGGFIWKWWIDNPKAGGHKNSGYTPQNKPVINEIRKWYSISK